MNADTRELPTRRILFVVDRDFGGMHEPEAAHAAAAVRGADLLVVAPAGAVAGERWVIDRGARERQAHERVAAWTEALAPHARSIAWEVGDADPRMALEDAHAIFAPEVTLTLSRTPLHARRLRGHARRVSARRPVVALRPRAVGAAA